MIVVNCGVLLPDIIESELFEHEKGSFTGALEKRIGRSEEADGENDFFDETGKLRSASEISSSNTEKGNSASGRFKKSS